MAVTLKYASTRAEVWDWYWRAWRKKLWVLHAYSALFFIALALIWDGHWPPHDYAKLLYGLLAAGVFVVFLVAFPQLMFKPQHRELTASEDGLYTKIGNKSRAWSWREISTIEETPELVTITGKNGNALLIPRRAFDSEEHKRLFAAAVETWHRRGAN
ncbi:YcxB family protein [Bradyrhizobium sp. HKCCYLRH3059]|uniref:YcxB family protein n=1 Tax=Bradyrhizobium sp. HKCCYLRH3059 TaxID=3420745 RepID=UPI003EB6EF30